MPAKKELEDAKERIFTNILKNPTMNMAMDMLTNQEQKIKLQTELLEQAANVIKETLASNDVYESFCYIIDNYKDLGVGPVDMDEDEWLALISEIERAENCSAAETIYYKLARHTDGHLFADAVRWMDAYKASKEKP